MKTTVDLPDQLMVRARKYASVRHKTLKDVLIEALNLLVSDSDADEQRPGWECLFGAFQGDAQIKEVDRIVDEEFSRVDLESWR